MWDSLCSSTKESFAFLAVEALKYSELDELMCGINIKQFVNEDGNDKEVRKTIKFLTTAQYDRRSLLCIRLIIINTSDITGLRVVENWVTIKPQPWFIWNPMRFIPFRAMCVLRLSYNCNRQKLREVGKNNPRNATTRQQQQQNITKCWFVWRNENRARLVLE